MLVSAEPPQNENPYNQAMAVRKTDPIDPIAAMVVGTSPQPIQIGAWAKLPWLIHGFSTRAGGVSTVYWEPENPRATQSRALQYNGKRSRAKTIGDLNLGYTASDSRANVDANRRLFVRTLTSDALTGQSLTSDAVTSGASTHPNATRGNSRGHQPASLELTTLRQIHSDLVRVLTLNATPPKTSTPQLPLQGDGMMTSQPGLLLAIQTADCIPVLVADRRLRVVAAFHAGWRGTAKRIVEKGIGTMRLVYGSQPKDLIAAIGPGIGQCCYAVGEEVMDTFESQFSYAPQLFREVYDSDPIREKYPMLFLTARAPGHSNLGPSTHLDLWEANRRQLVDAGVLKKNISLTAQCTACNRAQFFSHRAEHGFTGRMLSGIGIRS